GTQIGSGVPPPGHCARAKPAWLMRMASASSKQVCDVRMLDLIWRAARAGRRDGVGSNEYGLGPGVNAGRRVGARWKSGREASSSGEPDMRRELTPSRGHVGMLAREARPPPCPDPPLRLLETRATVSCDYCMPDRMRMPITVCRGLAVPIREFWPKDQC